MAANTPRKKKRIDPTTVADEAVQLPAKSDQQARADDQAHVAADLASNALALNPTGRDPKGRFVAKLTDDDWQHGLDMLSHGAGMLNVTRELNVSRAAFFERANRDPEFAAKLRFAQEQGAFAIVENSLNVAAGGELSSGSIERDKLIVKTAFMWGKALAPRYFGEKIQIDQRTITITIPSNGPNGDLTAW